MLWWELFTVCTCSYMYVEYKWCVFGNTCFEIDNIEAAVAVLSSKHKAPHVKDCNTQFRNIVCRDWMIVSRNYSKSIMTSNVFGRAVAVLLYYLQYLSLFQSNTLIVLLCASPNMCIKKCKFVFTGSGKYCTMFQVRNDFMATMYKYCSILVTIKKSQWNDCQCFITTSNVWIPGA